MYFETATITVRDRGLRFDGVVIGGALSLLGTVSRPTDVEHSGSDNPSGDSHRRARFRSGNSRDRRDLTRLCIFAAFVVLASPSIDGQPALCAKLFALCVRGIDLGDCIALAPTSDELQNVLTWLQLQDANPDWPEHVRNTIADVAKRIRHGI
jgi:hypothetical protein